MVRLLYCDQTTAAAGCSPAYGSGIFYIKNTKKREKREDLLMKAKRILAALTAMMICLSVTVQPALADFEEALPVEAAQTEPAVEESSSDVVTGEEERAETEETVAPEEEPEQELPPEEVPAEPETVEEIVESAGKEPEEISAAEEPTAPAEPEAVLTEEADTAVQPEAVETAPVALTEPEQTEAAEHAAEAEPAVQDVSGVELNESNFPDEAFREVVKAFDTDADDVLSPEEIAAVTGITANRKGISDLTGIAYFTALKVLNVSENQLTSLDLSSNTALGAVYVSDNRLTTLNVAGLGSLMILWADNNNLTSLDLSDNPLDGGQAFSVTENALTQITLPRSGQCRWEAQMGNQRLPGGKEVGYQLKWYTDPSYKQPLQSADGMISCSGQTLYIQAEAIQYTLTFSAGNEPVSGQTAEQKVTYDQSVQLPVCGFTPTDSEREFAGWTLNGKQFTAGQEVKNLTDRDGATLELVAQWRYKDYSSEQYTITLYDGSGKNEQFQANYGSPVAITTGLTKEHYHLVGWARQEGGPVWLKAGKTISYARPSLLQADLGQPAALYAVWEIDRHTVNFAGTGSTMRPVTVEYGGAITLPAAPHRTGYVFEGWFGEDNKIWDEQSGRVEKDMTLTARYRAAEFNVRFEGNGADSGTMSDMHVTYDQAQALSVGDFQRDWHDFEGWSFTPEGQILVMDGADASRLSVTDGDTVTLYAVWKRQQTDVTVTVNGEQYVYKTGLGIALDIPEPQRTGWRFTGWLDENGSPWQADTAVTGALNLTAAFEPVEYTVVFDGNGADNPKGMENAGLSLTYDQKVELPANRYTRVEHTFLGWSLTPGGKVAYGDGASVEALTASDGAVVTLYAVWQAPQPSKPESGTSDTQTGENTNVSAPASQGQTASGNSEKSSNVPTETVLLRQESAPADVAPVLIAERFASRPAQNGSKEQPGTEAAMEEMQTPVQPETDEAPQKAEEPAPQQMDDARKTESSRPDWVRTLALAVGAVVLVVGGGFAAVYALHFKKR